MDPMTVIVSALSFAAAQVGDQAVKDGYEALKALIVRRFGSRQPQLAKTLEEHAKDPSGMRASAEASLSAAGADRDQEIVDRATDLVKRVEMASPGISGGLVGQIEAMGGRVVVANTIHGGVHFG